MPRKPRRDDSASARRATIQDIADHAGVGRGTVSRVLNDHPYVSDEARAKVMEAMEALDYRPNLTARQMRTQRSRLIGFLADEVATSPYAGDIIKGAYDAARQHGYMILIVSAGETLDYAEEAVETLFQRDVDALIYAAMYHHGVRLPAGMDEAAAIVVNSFDVSQRVTSVVPDEQSGGYEATRYLLDAGHERVAFINVNDLSPGIPASHGRLAGYQQALAERGIPYNEALVTHGYGNSEHGYDGALTLLERGQPFTGLFCGNDRMAMGAYDALREHGLRIPQDVAIVGFDNQVSVADALRPSLTTMQLPHYAMGAWAVNHLIEQLEGESQPPQVYRLRCPLVVRQSV